MQEQRFLPRPALTRRTLGKVPGEVWTVLVAVVIFAVVSHFILQANPGPEPQFRLSFKPLLTAGLALQVHVLSAITTFITGVVILAAPKGRTFHRTLGWVWVIAMAITAGSSFLLSGLMGSSLSLIHGLSAWVLIGLPFGVAAARRKDIRRHRREMTSMFVGGMLIAGLFTFLPGRLMWSLFFVA